ncbi:MAG: hypothetical protein JWQ78_840 [Sediminibacterium sp.]|nr:hypothetical protein [Sediminibacterium sp.]
MSNRLKEKNPVNRQFDASPEILYWARKYQTSPKEIEQIFRDCNYSIAKTIAVLQNSSKAAA